MLKHPKEGGMGIRDYISTIDARRIGILKNYHKGSTAMDAVDREKTV